MSYWYKNVLPFPAMVAVECSNVGIYIVYKAATLKGLSYCVFVFYSFAIATLVLLPLIFIFPKYFLLTSFSISYPIKIKFLTNGYLIHVEQQGFLHSSCLSSIEFSYLDWLGTYENITQKCFCNLIFFFIYFAEFLQFDFDQLRFGHDIRFMLGQRAGL